MKTVRVAALQTFPHGDRSVAKGSIVELPAIEAAILARKGWVSLDRRYLTADVTPAESPDPEQPHRRRRYRRRDLVAEEP